MELLKGLTEYLFPPVVRGPRKISVGEHRPPRRKTCRPDTPLRIYVGRSLITDKSPPRADLYMRNLRSHGHGGPLELALQLILQEVVEGGYAARIHAP